jgi:hypothetical protein
MKKIFLAVILSFFLFFSLSFPFVLAQSSSVGGVDDQLKFALQSQGGCGTVGKSCCGTEITLPARINPPNITIPAVGGIIALLVEVINTLYIPAYKIIVPFAQSLINKSITQPPCPIDGVASDPDITKRSTCMCLNKQTFNIDKLCMAIGKPTEKSECLSCSNHGIWTAVGCVDFTLQDFIRDKVFGWGVGLAGIIALLCIMYSAFTLQTSRGNPEKIKKAQEMLTSCIMGLMLIIFSVFILRLIGVGILKIPGFT